MRRAVSLLLATCLSVLFMIRPAAAEEGFPTGAFVNARVVLAGYLMTNSSSYSLVAFRDASGESTRIVMARNTQWGLEPFDDVVLPADALSVQMVGGHWVMMLSAVLATLGSVSLTMESWQGPPDTTTFGCQTRFVLHSPSSSLSTWGHLSGTIGSEQVNYWICSAWGVGSDLSGVYNLMNITPL